MRIGVTFPQNEIGSDPAVVRDYAQAAEGLGYSHLLAFDHVLGADPANRPGWQGYTHRSLFHEPFVLFGYLAALERLRGYIREAGRDPSTVGIEARVNANSGDPDEWARQTNAWRELGATHITINTMNAGYTSPIEHIEAIRRYKVAIGQS